MSRRKSQTTLGGEALTQIEEETPDYAELYQVLVKYDVAKYLDQNLEEVSDWILQIIGLTITEKLPVKTILRYVSEAGKNNTRATVSVE